MKTDDLNKSSLRALCKTHNVKGYGNMSNAQMRAALADSEPKAGKPKKTAKTGKAQPSVR